MQVTFTDEQYQLVKGLIGEYYDRISQSWTPTDPVKNRIGYGAVIAMRIPMAEKAWEEYCEKYPDPDWRAYPSKEEFFKDQFTIYPSDMTL